MEKKVLENHKSYLERVSLYRSAGYEVEKERDFILDRSLPVSGKILEIGTGKGHFALALAKRGYAFTSVDISPQEQAIALLNLRYFGLEKQVIFKIEDATHLSFPDQSFEVIFSVNVFHHLERPLMVLGEIVRLLRHGGKVVLSDFSDTGLEIINSCHAAEGRTHEHFKHRMNEAKGYFIKEGLRIDECQSRIQNVLIAHRS